MIITFDIETLQITNDEVIDQLRSTIKPPQTHKKPETIAAWMAENQESALADMIAKTGLDGLYGSVACISWQVDDGEIQSTLDSDTETIAILRFYDAIRQAVKVECHGGSASQQVQFCGQNILGFDLPFLKHRSMILGIKPPPDILKAMSAKPWDNCIADTMLMWSTDSQKRTSMDKLCRAFGIEGKGDFDGSMVNDEWVNGDRQKVITYCEDDVRRTREIYKRMMWL
jgi:hypothetical protein